MSDYRCGDVVESFCVLYDFLSLTDFDGRRGFCASNQIFKSIFVLLRSRFHLHIFTLENPLTRFVGSSLWTLLGHSPLQQLSADLSQHSGLSYGLPTTLDIYYEAAQPFHILILRSQAGKADIGTRFLQTPVGDRETMFVVVRDFWLRTNRRHEKYRMGSYM